MKKANKGFTLIEMMLVVGIIALLSAVIIPRFSDFRVTAAAESRNAQLAAVRTQLELFNQDTGGYPSAMTEVGWGSNVTDYWPNGVPLTGPDGGAWTYDGTAGTIQ